MVVTLNEVRELGFQRIWKIVVGDDKEGTLFKDLREVASLLSICKIAPYSALSYWRAISTLSSEEVGGLRRLMQDTAPMISELKDPDVASKRKFRNSWTLLWEKFGEACGLNAYDVSLLSDVGIKLPVMIAALEAKNTSAMKAIRFSRTYYSAFSVPEEGVLEPSYLYNNFPIVNRLCTFYNMVIGWYLSVHNETDTTDLLSYLVITDFDEFVDFFKCGDRIWLSDSDLDVNDSKINTLTGVKFEDCIKEA